MIECIKSMLIKWNTIHNSVVGTSSERCKVPPQQVAALLTKLKLRGAKVSRDAIVDLLLRGNIVGAEVS
jgi:hypothetical protein